MKIVSREQILQFIEKHSDAKGAIESWWQETIEANWREPKDIKERYRTVSFLGGNIVIFNIKGNNYRLVVKIAYQQKTVLIKWIGTHAEYDKQQF
ncbi:MAG: type II toxin-antitoxin system HigB family toxin [Deltaproteobacteria bacterium]|nr:type II toxin-antitoxin system HigB family toxin [Deltaproteobacteria bacterium]